jgi:hypothetical protein
MLDLDFEIWYLESNGFGVKRVRVKGLGVWCIWGSDFRVWGMGFRVKESRV